MQIKKDESYEFKIKWIIYILIYKVKLYYVSQKIFMS